MFTVECARIAQPEGPVSFVLADEAGDNHDDWCELEVLFTVDAVYGPETDTGSGITGDFHIAEIAVRKFGPSQPLSGDEFDAAFDFLRKYYREDLAEAGLQAADLIFYNEA